MSLEELDFDLPQIVLSVSLRFDPNDAKNNTIEANSTDSEMDGNEIIMIASACLHGKIQDMVVSGKFSEQEIEKSLSKLSIMMNPNGAGM